MYKTIENGVSCFNQGEEKSKSGDYQGAISDYSKVIDLDPEYAYAYLYRGEIKEKLGDKEGADNDNKKGEQFL